MRFLITLVALLSLTAVPAAAQTRGREILDGMIEALGGEAFLAVKDIHTTGRFFMFTKGELSGADNFADYIKFPDMERTEFGRDKKKLSIQINKGDEGWIVADKEVKPQPVTELENFLAQFKTSYEYVLRFVINNKATTVQSVGGEIIDFKRVDIVELRDPEKNRIQFFVDRKTHLPVKMEVRRITDNKLHVEEYGNWHAFDGVQTPLFVARFSDGMKTMEIRTETIAYNSGLPDSLFAPPSAK